MKTIVFFSLPAYGHTNPTLPVVLALTDRGHQVIYYSFSEFKERIEDAGAIFVGCDAYLPKKSKKELDKQAGKDFAALIEMLAETTIALEDKVVPELQKLQPDCIVSDSLCLWGTLFARKLNCPYICSTTSFAFNQETAKLMRGGFVETMRLLLGMRRIRKKLHMLRTKGYKVEGLVSILQNDNATDTIVYTAKSFQPYAETFSERFAFVGPALELPEKGESAIQDRPFVYISLGSVFEDHEFIAQCIQAFRNEDIDVLLTTNSDIHHFKSLNLPENIEVQKFVPQLEILQKADVFLTHSGMNSVNESLYFGVPMVVFPQHSEQRLVAEQVIKTGTGVELKKGKRSYIRKAVQEIINNPVYKQRAEKLGRSLQEAGGAREAAIKIEEKIDNGAIHSEG